MVYVDATYTLNTYVVCIWYMSNGITMIADKKKKRDGKYIYPVHMLLWSLKYCSQCSWAQSTAEREKNDNNK